MFAASHKGSFSCVGACYVPSYSMTVCVPVHPGPENSEVVHYWQMNDMLSWNSLGYVCHSPPDHSLYTYACTYAHVCMYVCVLTLRCADMQELLRPFLQCLQHTKVDGRMEEGYNEWMSENESSSGNDLVQMTIVVGTPQGIPPWQHITSHPCLCVCVLSRVRYCWSTATLQWVGGAVTPPLTGQTSGTPAQWQVKYIRD